MIQRLRQCIPVFVALGAGGVLLAVSGLASIEASGGHWAITEWFLQFSKRRSIATHTLLVDMPSLEHEWLVLKGAGHYETGCRPCHGSPDLPHPRIAKAMLPPPPYLAKIVKEREPVELFYVVKHGIKLTGMPAWPAQGRDDEVAAVVAFLLELPELDAQEYRRLVHGGSPETATVAPLEDMEGAPAEFSAVHATCARCHGPDGRGRGNAAFPAIAGQRREYLENALFAYARGERASGIMEPVAAALSEEEIRALAAHFAGHAPRDPERGDVEAIARGERIATDGVQERKIPSCADCHGPARREKNPAYPSLAGQYADYLVLQLERFADGTRGGSRFAHLMEPVAHQIEPAEMRDVAAYYASLRSEE